MVIEKSPCTVSVENDTEELEVEEVLVEVFDVEVDVEVELAVPVDTEVLVEVLMEQDANNAAQARGIRNFEVTFFIVGLLVTAPMVKGQLEKKAKNNLKRN